MSFDFTTTIQNDFSDDVDQSHPYAATGLPDQPPMDWDAWDHRMAEAEGRRRDAEQADRIAALESRLLADDDEFVRVMQASEALRDLARTFGPEAVRLALSRAGITCPVCGTTHGTAEYRQHAADAHGIAVPAAA